MSRISEISPYLLSDDRHRPFERPSAEIPTAEPCEECDTLVIYNATLAILDYATMLLKRQQDEVRTTMLEAMTDLKTERIKNE